MNQRNDKRNYRKGKGNNSRSRYSNKDEKKQDLEVQESYPTKNDPNWYFTDKLLADQVSRFSFNQYLGNDGSFLGDGSLEKYQVQTAMRVLLNPSPGFSHNATAGFSGINQIGIKLYTLLSSGNSKNTLYAPQDVTTLLLALGEVLSMSEVARRALGVAFTYNKRNWMYPKNIIRICGFDPDDMLQHLAQYRIWFNTVVNQINKIAFPASVKYFEKCISLYSGILLDSESPMAQSIVYLPHSTWDIDETSYSGGTILATVPLFTAGSTSYTMGQFLQMLETKINLILTSASYNYIYSDVLRLYGESGLYTVPYISEDYIVVPEYNPMALLQLDNATIVHEPTAAALDLVRGITPLNDVYPDPNNNRLLYMPQFTSAMNLVNPDIWKEATIVNFPHSMGNPDEAQRIESTRFTVRMNVEVDSGGKIVTGAALPDHYVVSIWTFKNDPTTPAIGIPLSYSDYDPANATVLSATLNIYDALAKFERAPRLYLQNITAPYDTVMISGDLDYYTTIDFDYLNRVNQLAYTALFDIR